jgi:hypothetical protein
MTGAEVFFSVAVSMPRSWQLWWSGRAACRRGLNRFAAMACGLSAGRFGFVWQNWFWRGAGRRLRGGIRPELHWLYSQGAGLWLPWARLLRKGCVTSGWKGFAGPTPIGA